MRTKVIAALLAVLTALGGLNLFQSIKKKLSPEEDYAVETVVEKDDITVKREGKRIVIRTSAMGDADVDVDVDTDFDFDFDFDFDEAIDVAATGVNEEVMISERFDVREGATLRVDVSHAEFNIVTGSSNEAEVEVTLDSRRMNKARERFEDMNWRVTQEDGDIVILADDPSGWSNFNMDIDVTVHIPARFNIDMETSHGDVLLGDLEGELRLLTSHGDVELGNVMGNRMWIKSSHGDIAGESLRAAVIDLETSHADIEFDSIESEEFSASTSHADVEIESLRGESRIRTSHGDVQVELADELGADIETQHGDVTVYVASDARLDLDLRGAEVEVSSRLDANGRISEESVDARINGGGRTLRVRTTHGEVAVR